MCRTLPKGFRKPPLGGQKRFAESFGFPGCICKLLILKGEFGVALRNGRNCETLRLS